LERPLSILISNPPASARLMCKICQIQLSTFEDLIDQDCCGPLRLVHVGTPLR
jgi:hypothetical protein